MIAECLEVIVEADRAAQVNQIVLNRAMVTIKEVTGLEIIIGQIVE